MHNLHNIFNKALLALICSWGLFGCQNDNHGDVGDDVAYSWHYKNLDSTRVYAEKALKVADGKDAVALNDLAFVDIAKMEYGKAEEKLKRIGEITDNQIELTIADVQMMRICQRRSLNKEFYDYYNSATERLKRIYEDDDVLNDYRREEYIKRLAYAESEFDIVSSTYYYYVGLQDKADEALGCIIPEELIQVDSAQTANYHYNVGADGDIRDLRRCMYIAEQQNLKFFIANCMQALAENGKYDDQNSKELAHEALRMFEEYGDVYQIAGAYRTVANCMIAEGNYADALKYLKKALNVNPRIDFAPDLLASIHERLSVVYAALGDMDESLYNRKEYLLLQEGKRQDRFLENRLEMLEKESVMRSMWIMGVMSAIVVLALLLLLFYRMRRKVEKKNEEEGYAELQRLKECLEQLTEEKSAAEQKLADMRKRNEENRAKINLVNSLIPLIDRMAHAVERRPLEVEYIKEITDEINRKNELLTEWIQMRKGELNMKIETFPLQSLFEILKKSKVACQMKGVTLDVKDTDMVLKADKILTMFMLNTLVDNARKFTDAGGRITVSATEKEGYVEVSVEDTGKGIDEEELPMLFNHNVHDNHGFGLMNCKGIIEKYKKVSGLFRDAAISAESKVGKGSRVYFRLPKGKHALEKHSYGGMRTMLMMIVLTAGLLTSGEAKARTAEQMDSLAVVALQEGDLNTYEKYNTAYINALKEHSVDRMLPEYCRTMQEGATNKKISMILLIIMLVSIIPLYYLLVWRFVKKNKISRKGIADSIAEQKILAEMQEDECRRINMEISGVHVSNNVSDNCLSALKHETMYYPNRIHLIADALNAEKQADVESLKEMISYYRSLYMILDEQAMRGIKKFKLNMQGVTVGQEKILGDSVMTEYLFELLGNPKDYTAKTQEDYVIIDVKHVELSEITYLICRQIVRDMAEMSGHRACGVEITDDTEETKKNVTIKLPRYGKV